MELQKTMLGMPARSLPDALGPTPSPASPASPPAHGPVPMKTMLGVAIPGIAPLQASARSVAEPPAQPSPAPRAVQDVGSKHRTMLGVASPDLLPEHLRQQAPSLQAPPVAVVPAPLPLEFAPLPAPPRVPQKRGLSAVAVVGIVSAVVAVAGALGLVFAWRSSSALTARHELDDTGREILRIGCPNCPDGTVIALGASSAKLQAHEATLPLPAPLAVGDNDLNVTLDRPGAGRDEAVRVRVPVAYRVTTDLTTLAATPPVITVRVEADPKSQVVVDGTKVALDAAGRANVPIALGALANGPSDEVSTFERPVPFSVTLPRGTTESGKVIARTAITPLHLDAPGLALYTVRPTVAVIGQTRANAKVTIGGSPAPVDATGHFRIGVALSPGESKTIEIVASAPGFAPRTVLSKVERVASVRDAQAALDRAAPIGFDAFAADPRAKVGSDAILEGEVLDARVEGGSSVLVVSDRHACAAAKVAHPSSERFCVVRVTYGDEVAATRGSSVRAYGKVAGGIMADGALIPQVAASLVVPVGKRARR